MGRFPLIAAAGALVGFAAAAAPASGAWSPPQRVSTGPGDASAPEVAADAAGDAVAVWVQDVAGRGRVVASARRAGGPWSHPRPVSPPGLAAIDPDVAMTPGGGAIVVWRQPDRTRTLRVGSRRVHQAVYLARARERSAAGRWGPARRLSDPRQKVGGPRVAVDGSGVAVAAWHWGTGTRAGTPGHVGRVQVAERRPDRAWTRARSVSTAAGCALETRLPDVAAGAAGAVVWWQCDLPRGRSATVAVARGAAPGSWSREARLPFDAAGDQLAELAVAGDGAAIALRVAGGAATAWRGAAPLGVPGALDLAPVPLAGARGAARGGGRPALAPGVGAWIAGGLEVAELGAAGAPATVRDLGGDPPARSNAAVAAAADGTAVAAARAARGVVAAVRPAGGDWTVPGRVSAAAPADAASAVAVAAGGGRALAFWARRDGGRLVVERAEWGPGA
jgi:hypothetical protein